MKYKFYFFILTYTFIQSFTSAIADENKLIFKVTKGTISKKIVASGEIFSPNSSDIRIGHYGDSWENKIAWIAPEGSFVKKGDVVLKIDTSTIEKSLDQANNQLLSAQLNLEIAELKLKMDISAGEADIKTKQFNVEKAKLDVQKGDYVPLNEQKKSMIALNSAIADLMQSKKNLEQNKLTDNLQIKSLKAPVQQYKSNLSRYQDDIKKMALTADNDGYVIYSYVSNFNGGKVRPGAGVSPFPFSKVAEISNTSNLQARLYVPEIDFMSIKENIPVTLTLLSNPNEIMNGKVININKIPSTATERRGSEAASPSDLLPQNTVLVAIDKIPLDTLPGMTVKATLLPPEKKDVLKVPLFAISSEPKSSPNNTTVDTISGNHEAFVFMRKKNEKKWQWQKVITGEASYDFIEIKDGLAEDDEVYSQ